MIKAQEHYRVKIPKAIEDDLHRAVEILKDAGCTDVFLFGSFAKGTVREGSDLDMAIRGCPHGKFFHLLGKLLLELKRPVDLVNLDRRDAFACYLEEKGDLLKIA